MKRASRQRLEGMAVHDVSPLLRVLPRRASLALGRALGRGLAVLDERHRDIAADNLRHAFPDWPEERFQETARAVYAHFGAVLIDLLWLAHRPLEVMDSLLTVEGLEHAERALAAGKGAMFVTAHFGNWEVHGVFHGRRVGTMGVVARPLDNPQLDAILCAFRSRSGNQVIYKQRAVSQVLRLLRDGRGVALVVDQNVQPGDGVFVDFFGRKAAATTIAAALALKTGAALVPCRAELRPDGGYRVIYDPPVEVRKQAEKEGEILRLTQELTRSIEGWVRAAPEQWLWLHRRWKTRPAGEATSSS